MLKLVLLCAALLCCVYAAAPVRARGVYCGRRLAEVLATLCWGPDEHKRARWGPPAAALAGVRGKRGPVDECCYKSCTVDELMTYC